MRILEKWWTVISSSGIGIPWCGFEIISGNISPKINFSAFDNSEIFAYRMFDADCLPVVPEIDWRHYPPAKYGYTDGMNLKRDYWQVNEGKTNISPYTVIQGTICDLNQLHTKNPQVSPEFFQEREEKGFLYMLTTPYNYWFELTEEDLKSSIN